MGAQASRRLVKAGHRVQGFDVRTESIESFAKDGGIGCTLLSEVCKDASIIVLFVVNSAQVESVVFGPDGIAKYAEKGTMLMVCTTMSASDARKLSKLATEHGLVYVDAPVSGGVVGAESGTLSIMASGLASALDACAPLFSAMGTRILRVGEEPGQGATFKTINQLLCGVHLAAAGEAFAMASKAGLDVGQVLELVGNSAASSWMLKDRGPAMVSGTYEPVRSAVDIFVKDLGVVMDLAREMRFPAPVSAAALQSFLAASGAGFGRKDDAAVTEAYRLRAQSDEE